MCFAFQGPLLFYGLTSLHKISFVLKVHVHILTFVKQFLLIKNSNNNQNMHVHFLDSAILLDIQFELSFLEMFGSCFTTLVTYNLNSVFLKCLDQVLQLW